VRTRIDERGNVVRYSYDGVDRRILRLAELTDTGTGVGSITSVQATSYVYDYAAGLSAVTDTDGYSTYFDYDALGRLVQVDLADGTTQIWTYDARDCPVLHVDANGSTATTTCDTNGRSSFVAITAGPGVSPDTSFEAFSYDGAGRVVSAADDDVTTTRAYDSLGQVLAESVQVQALGGPVLLTTTAVRDAAGNVTDLAYPGGRVVNYEYDALNRVSRILESGSPLCTNWWVGPRERLERVNYGNGTRTNYYYDNRLRPRRTLTRDGQQTRAERRSTWNATGELSQRENLLSAGTDFQYIVDSLGRLVQSDEFPSQGGQLTITYTLDDWGCRTLVSGGQTGGPYSKSALLPPGDAQVHQYTTTPLDLRLYDENGNLIFMDSPGIDLGFVYDARDRVEAMDLIGPGVLTTYSHDALGRRARVVEDATGAALETVYATWDGQVLEETDGFGGTQATYVVNLPGDVSAGVVDLLTLLALQDRPMGGEVEVTADHLVGMQRGGTDYVLHQDPEGSVAIATGPAGSTAERYEYDDFGGARMFNGAFTPIPFSTIQNPYLFHGERLDDATRFYVRGPSLYDPVVDRSLSRGTPDAAPLPELRALVSPYSD
jgi:YD repeat-containing protein